MKLTAYIALLLSATGATAQVEITSFHGNGTLTWTNSSVPAICHVEWAPNLTSGWSRSWASLKDILMTNQSHSAPVPMFYRVVCDAGDFQKGLALYLPLDNHTDDLSTNNTDAINSGAIPTADMFGNPGKAYAFNGTGNQIYVPDVSSLDVTNLTLSFWLNITSFAQVNELVNKFGGDGNISFGSEIGSGDRKIIFRVCQGGSTATLTDIKSTTTLSASTWYHFAGTYNGAEMRLYINGNLETVAAKTGNIFNSSESLRIGRYGYYTWYYNGAIDEVAIWNRALSETEIRLLYLKGGRP